ncbi:YceI family protein [Aliarcobacter lanthieri]|uniref:YceI family protein n=1 Tax=Aliarcobacter lanthieri TaxID=1355374 RepID=UPI003AA8AC4B
MNLLKIALSTLLLTGSLFAKEYRVNTNSSNVDFQITYQKSTLIEGSFKELYGKIDYDENSNLIKSINGEIEVDSVQSINKELDNLISSKKILNAEDFPTISFITTKIEENKVFGNLKIKDVVRNIEFELENNGVFLDTLYLTLTATIKRSFFDLSWDELTDIGSSVTSNDIKIKINIEANLVDKFYFKDKK